MAPKLSTEARIANLAKAKLAKVREVSSAQVTQPATGSDLTALAICQDNLASAKAQVTSLEVTVEELQADRARLSRELDAANSKIVDLNFALQAEHERSESLYKSLRTERRARQHGDKRKQVLSETIAELRETRDSAAETKRA